METRVRTDCLNFDVSLCTQIKQISVRGRKHREYIFVGFKIPLQFKIAKLS